MYPIKRKPQRKLRTYPAKHGWNGDVAMKEGRMEERGNRRGRQALSKMGQGSPTPTGWPNTVCSVFEIIIVKLEVDQFMYMQV